ncbi:DEAD/DEAH box helicase [Lacrimispora sp.]|uniref:DEAD/DEAH box helicase n=1 Tax=Lacrimispora sp. TaxID=2719234 RepID=UPI0029E226C9|nr:hypothetical protein [Lacrimispora sp.]
MISLEELEKIDKLIHKYTVLEIQKTFLKKDIDNNIDNKEINFLLNIGMLLSKSAKDNNKNRVLKIATIIPIISNNESHLTSCRLLMSRLKNYPTVKVIEDNAQNYYLENTSFLDKIRELYEQQKNTISIYNKDYLISDIQYNLYELYKNHHDISISAPTSIGKSYLFTRLMINELLTIKKSLVYLVPTRALINQILNDVKKEFKNLEIQNKFFLTSSSDTQKIEPNKIGIFILTQERFYQLCNLGTIDIGTLIIDEAQNMMDNSRGVLLEYSIRYAKQVWENIKLIFISPFVNNPQIFLNKFSLSNNSKSYRESQTTVRQNIIKLQTAPRGYKILINNNVIPDSLLINRSGNISEKIFNVYKNFNNGNNSLIYCNRPDMAIKVCNEFYNSDLFQDSEDEDLINFAEFIEVYINKSYLLAKYVRKGIVFHYGKLPAFIRIGIEELASDGKFQVIACTPTLLQGVNIPAQNIYIFNPKKNNKQMTNLDFWNLAGRAGRMSYDLDGNVIIIDNNEWEDINKYDKKGALIKCATDLELEQSKIIKKIIENGNYIENNLIKKEEATYLQSAMIFDKISSTENEIPLDGLTEIEKEQVYGKISTVIQDFTPPKELLIKLLGVSYKNIEGLWDYFKGNDQHIENMIIGHPMARKSNSIPSINDFDESFEIMVRTINQYLCSNDLYTTEKSYKRFIGITKAWIREESLKNIIFYKFNDFTNSKIVTDKVSSEIDFLNSTVRFKLVQAVYSYQEILKAYLIQTNREILTEKIVNLPMYIELGACKDATIDLISLGLNRELSIELVKNCKIDEENFINSLRNADISTIHNHYAQKRIREFILTL